VIPLFDSIDADPSDCETARLTIWIA